MKFSPQELTERQVWPLEQKVRWTLRQIRIWYDYWDGKVYVAFSGGKDSTVLLHLVRSLYPDAPAVFVNSGMEFPEIVQFVRGVDNVISLRPSMRPREIFEKHGYPLVSKRTAGYLREIHGKTCGPHVNQRLFGIRRDGGRTEFCVPKKWRFLHTAPFRVSDGCCDVVKVMPFHQYVKETGRHPYIGMLASDSRNRRMQYLQYGCNHFDAKDPTSKPMSVWTETDVWAYIREHDLSYSTIYDMGYERTGCVYCCFGVHMEKQPNRFQRMKRTHPKLWSYCMDKLRLRAVLEYMDIPIEWSALKPRKKLRTQMRKRGVQI